jgi:flagellar motor switch protein FliN/FliY
VANDIEDILDPAEIDALLKQPTSIPTAANPLTLSDHAAAQFEVAKAQLGSVGGNTDLTAAPYPYAFQPFDEDDAGAEVAAELENQEQEFDLRIELGRTELLSDEVLKLREGSVVALDKLAGDPVDIMVNDRLVARGEVLVLNDKFCVRVAEILAPARV